MENGFDYIYCIRNVPGSTEPYKTSVEYRGHYFYYTVTSQIVFDNKHFQITIKISSITWVH